MDPTRGFPHGILSIALKRSQFVLIYLNELRGGHNSFNLDIASERGSLLGKNPPFFSGGIPMTRPAFRQLCRSHLYPVCFLSTTAAGASPARAALRVPALDLHYVLYHHAVLTHYPVQSPETGLASKRPTHGRPPSGSAPSRHRRHLEQECLSWRVYGWRSRSLSEPTDGDGAHL